MESVIGSNNAKELSFLIGMLSGIRIYGMCIFSKDGISSPFYIIVWEWFTKIITIIVVIEIFNQFAIFVGASRFTYSKCLHIIVVVNRNGAPSVDTCGHLHITETEKQIISLLFIQKMITKYVQLYSASFSVYLPWLITWVDLGNFEWENTRWIIVVFSSIFHRQVGSQFVHRLLKFCFANFSFETIFTSIVFSAFTVRCFSFSSLADSIISTFKPGNMVGKFIFSKVNVMGKSQWLEISSNTYIGPFVWFFRLMAMWKHHYTQWVCMCGIQVPGVYILPRNL